MSEHDLVAQYALDALPEAERRAFDAHLGTCVACQRELASYGHALDVLACDVEVRPPEALRARVLAAAADTPQLDAAPADTPQLDAAPAARADSAADRSTPRLEPPRRLPGRSNRWFAVAAAILVFALAAATLTAVGLWRRTGDLEQQLTQLRRQAAALTDQNAQAAQLAAVLAADDAELIDVQTDLAGGLRIAVADSVDAGAVVADALEAPPDGRAYQLWVIADAGPRSVGVIDRSEGVLGVVSGIGDAQAVAISVEPPGGSAAPTGPVVAQAVLD